MATCSLSRDQFSEVGSCQFPAQSSCVFAATKSCTEEEDGTTVNFEGMKLSISSLSAVSALQVIDGQLSLVLDGFKGVISLATQQPSSTSSPSSAGPPSKKRKSEKRTQDRVSEHTESSLPIKCSQPSQFSCVVGLDQDEVSLGKNMGMEPDTAAKPIPAVKRKPEKGTVQSASLADPPIRSLRKSRQVREDELLAMKLQEEEERVARSTKLRWLSPKQSGELPCARWGHCCTLVRQSPPALLVTGGDALDPRGRPSTLSDALLYDLENHRWSAAGDRAGVARAFHTAVLLESNSGRLLIVFGGENNSPGHKEVLSSLMIMDLDDGVWFNPNVTGEGPAARSGHSCVLSEEHCVLFGGCDARRKRRFNDVMVLDTKQWNWFHPPVHGTPPPPRAYHAAVLVGSKMVVLGGEGEKGALSDVHCLDLFTWEWTQITLSGDSLQPSCGHAAAVVEGGQGSPSHLLVFGGWGREGKLKDAKTCFLINMQDWTCRAVAPEGDRCPVACAGHTLTAVDKGQLVLFGGQAADETLLQQVLHLKLPRL